MSSALKSIERLVFQDCLSLVDINIPDSVEKIELGVVAGCVSLQSINVPESVHTIESSAFEGCASLIDVVLPSKLTQIDSEVFSKCLSLEKIDLKNVTNIYRDAFYGCCNLKEIQMNHVKLVNGIGKPFNGCTSLTTAGIKAPKGVAGVIINSIETHQKILARISSPQMSDINDAMNKKSELIRGVWKNYFA